MNTPPILPGPSTTGPPQPPPPSVPEPTVPPSIAQPTPFPRQFGSPYTDPSRTVERSGQGLAIRQGRTPPTPTPEHTRRHHANSEHDSSPESDHSLYRPRTPR